jgi:hypothetical protein
MKNFVYASLKLPNDLIKETPGVNGHTARMLAGPASGTYVLGSIDGVIQWIATEDC